jgi:phosphotransferase system enzyme I (PtsI)
MAMYRGIGASPGIVIGTAWVADRSRVAVVEIAITADQVSKEVSRFRSAMEAARDELQAIKEQLATTKGPEHLYVIDTHLLILGDSMLARETVGFIEREHVNAEWALKRTLRKLQEIFSGIEDDYLRERAHDIEVVVERILRNMVGQRHEPLSGAEGKVVVIAHDLAPTDVLQIDKDNVIGFATDMGGKTSHTTILARSLEIPAVVGLENITSEVVDGASIILDGEAGVVIVNPDQETFQSYLQKKQRQEYLEKELLKLRDLPAETRDGHRIRLMGNVEFVEEVPSLVGHGGEGIGLYRTEMIFLNRSGVPDEEEQFQAYSAVVKAMAPHPVTIRTLDIGGDKIAPELNLADEMNPALGLRAIRLSLRQPDIFKAQLRAILRAGVFGAIRIFFPMVSGVAEVRKVKALLLEAKEELRAEGIPFAEEVPLGIMIEIPSAVIIADLLAREVDFFSVGTNDLIQYSLAIDRTNEHLANLYEPLHPAILRSLKMVVDAAHAAGIEAAMCGEMAGESIYLPILLGLGFDQLSMNSVSIPKVKQILRRCSQEDAQRIVARAMQFATADEVDAFLKSEVTARFDMSID